MPSRGQSQAPKFMPDQPRELRRYFKELNHLFSNAKVTDDEEKKAHACRYLDVDSAELWESLPEFAAGETYLDFTKAIYDLYPGSEDERKWTVAAMDKLVSDRLQLGIRSLDDLGQYYRAFRTITQFLRDKNRISEAEQSRAFVRGFQPDLWDRIVRRLELKFPDHFPDEHYPFEQIHTAAKFVLHGTTGSSVEFKESSTSSATAPSSGASPSIKPEDLTSFLDKFATTLIQALAPKRSSGAPAIQGPQTQLPEILCAFCGLEGHFISNCLVSQQYIADGKSKKNAEGKVVLPNGSFCPRSLPGRFLKHRIDEWHKRNDSAPTTTSSMMYGVAVSPPSPPSPSLVSTNIAATKSSDDRIAELEKEIFALRNGRKFDGVEVPRRQARAAPVPSSPPPSASTNPEATKSAPAPAAPSSQSNTTQPASNASKPPVHPFAKVKEANYLPPHERNFASAATGKPGKEPAYHTQVPVYDPKIASEVYARSIRTPSVTISPEELWSISPEIRNKVREAIMPKRIATESSTNSAHMLADEPPSTSSEPIVIPDFFETYINSLSPDQVPEKLIVAKESHALRSIMIEVDNRDSIEGVVDPGSQIIAMSEAVCHDLGLIYDPTFVLHMQSANGEIDKSLGISRNVPAKIGHITLYLQIHVLRSPAYDILLGRPFDVLTESTVRNFANEDQTITITDPNSNRTVTIPTIARGRPKYRCGSTTNSSGFRNSRS